MEGIAGEEAGEPQGGSKGAWLAHPPQGSAARRECLGGFFQLLLLLLVVLQLGPQAALWLAVVEPWQKVYPAVRPKRCQPPAP